MTAAAELAGSHQLGDDRRGGLRGFALERFQALLQLGLGGFSFGSHALPEGAIRFGLLFFYDTCRGFLMGRFQLVSQGGHGFL